jgi:hypothetical protein
MLLEMKMLQHIEEGNILVRRLQDDGETYRELLRGVLLRVCGEYAQQFSRLRSEAAIRLHCECEHSELVLVLLFHRSTSRIEWCVLHMRVSSI